MDKMIQTLDKTYVSFVLEQKNITAYQLAKITGISTATFSKLLSGKTGLKWSSIAKIEQETGIGFKSAEHLIYATELSFCPHSKKDKWTSNEEQRK